MFSIEASDFGTFLQGSAYSLNKMFMMHKTRHEFYYYLGNKERFEKKFGNVGSHGGINVNNQWDFSAGFTNAAYVETEGFGATGLHRFTR